MMSVQTWILVGLMLLNTLIAVGFIVWGWQNGQFKDIESAKYRIFEEKEPEPWPNCSEVKK